MTKQLFTALVSLSFATSVASADTAPAKDAAAATPAKHETTKTATHAAKPAAKTKTTTKTAAKKPAAKTATTDKTASKAGSTSDKTPAPSK